MNNKIYVNVEKLFPELERFNYMMRWCKRSKNIKTKIKIVKHCIKIANSLCKSKYKMKVLRK